MKEINILSRDEFVEKFGSLFEGSRWVAEKAWYRQPFRDLPELHGAFRAAMYGAPREYQLGIIRAHPDLADKAAIAGGSLTVESTREQVSAGLDRLSPGEYESFTHLNAAYRQKFGFPLVICAREHTKDTILASAEVRLDNPPAQEIQTALEEISKIAWLRLSDMVKSRPKG